MKRRMGWWLLAALAWPAGIRAQSVAAAATSITLFNSGRVLVRRTLPLRVPAGMSTHSLALGQIDESTLALLDPGVSLTSIYADEAWSEDALLRRNIGRTFDLEQPDRSRRRATLLSVDPERWEWADGGVVFGRPGRIIWAKELVPVARVADVSLTSDRAREGLKVMYEATGGWWSAGYRLYVGGIGRLEAVASLNGGILDLADAETQLLAGDIGQAGVVSMTARPAMASMARDQVTTRQTVSSESVGEAHLYTLPSRVTFRPGIQLVVPLFNPVTAHADRLYVLSGALSYYGGLAQTPDEQPMPVSVSYRLTRKLGTAFGDLPLPAGAVSVFEADKAGRVQLIGNGSIDHTAPGEDVTVGAGTAFDVTAKRVQSDYSTTRTGGNGAPIGTVAMASYRVTLQNAKDSAVVVEVREDRGGEWSVVSSSVPAERRSSTRVVFLVTVPAKGTATLTYRVRVVW